MDGDLGFILEREKRNDGCIYFYMESENSIKCYDLSAYILTKMYPFIQLKKEPSPVSNGEVVVAYFDPEFCRLRFSGYNIEVGDDGVKVNIEHYSKEKREKWIDEFKKIVNGL